MIVPMLWAAAAHLILSGLFGTAAALALLPYRPLHRRIRVRPILTVMRMVRPHEARHAQLLHGGKHARRPAPALVVAA